MFHWLSFYFCTISKRKEYLILSIFTLDAWPILFSVHLTFSLCKLSHYSQLRKQWSLTLLEIQLNENNKLTVAIYLSGCCNRTGPHCQWIGSLLSISSCWGLRVYVGENMCTACMCISAPGGRSMAVYGWLDGALLSHGYSVHTHEWTRSCKNKSSSASLQ